MSTKKLTTNAGCPVVDNQNVMTAGPRGAADAECDVCGFVVKSCTEEGDRDN